MTKKPILLEFTPLLDVILLMLFLVLMQSEVRVDLMYEEARELVETELQQFEEEMELLRQDSMELDALRLGLEEDTGVIIVRLLPSGVGGHTRSITIEADTTTEITLSWDRIIRDTAARELSEALASSVQNSANAFSFIVFNYDGRVIFDDDRTLIRLAIHNLKLTNPQVFSVELDSR